MTPEQLAARHLSAAQEALAAGDYAHAKMHAREADRALFALLAQRVTEGAE